ncbi:MAG: glycosyl transferase, partial [Anaerolineaceae bacterium]|nr:glycosyl transferase [Anaerolineaceae bacterium]
TNAALHVDAIPVVEYTHPDALKQLTNADWVPQTMQSKVVEVDGIPVLVQFPFMLQDTQERWFTSNLAASSFETDRKQFLGNNEYGTWRSPLSLQQTQLGNHLALRGDNIGALLLPIGDLQPGATRRFVTLLGQSGSLQASAATINRYRKFEEVDAALEKISDFWNGYLSNLQVNTPEKDLDRMVNIYNPRQCWTTLNWSRYLSFYQLGYGSSRGIGFRDSSQDVMGVLASAPQAASELLLKLLSVQKMDGSAMHQFNPLTMIASEGDSLEREDRPHYYSDDFLWSILAVCSYIKETGKVAFLKTNVPFYDKDREEKPLETGTVLEHLRRGLAFTRKNVGAHGLPLLGFADWNDTVNLPSGAESLFTANLYGRALKEMIALAEFLGDTTSEQEYRQAYDEMQIRVEQAAWDGDWYVRYYDAQGNPIGSKQNQHGQIYVNGQSWAVISGFASEQRAKQAMQSVYERLNTSSGIKLSAPGFNGFDPSIGGITTYPPGAKENGGIFLHANPWAMIAETMLGNGERAYQYYKQINPAARNDQAETFECEPYVYPQNILGDEHPKFGLARNSWLSGTSSWAYQASTQFILGVRPDYRGLTIDPCIPSDWDGFEVVRQCRGKQYRIQVHNPLHHSKGVSRMIVDGKELPGCCVPYDLPGESHQVDIWLGN